MGKNKCPKCGSLKTSPSGMGYVQKGSAAVAAAIAGMVVNSISPIHTRTTAATYESFSSEYQCKNCGHEFMVKNKY